MCLGVVVLVVAIVALREPNGHVSAASQHKSASSVAKQTGTGPAHRTSAATSSGSTTHSSTPSTSSTSVKSVPLVVLNNTTVSGLAAQAANRFEAGGWTVSDHGNYQNDILSTCAYYDPSDPAAKTAAEALQAQYPSIKRVAPKFPELPSGPVVVVLTPDYSNG
jgi:LytR cell envelope-related transcriptional attenuator